MKPDTRPTVSLATAVRKNRVDTAVTARAGLPLLILMAAYLATQPVSTDVYLPALPEMGIAFGATAAQMQLTLSVFIGGFAVAQLLAGPLSDRFGRRPVVLAGNSLFVVALVGGALATSFQFLLAMRFVQAVGVCCMVVCTRAIVRDLFTPAQGTRVLARAMGWMAVAPLIGPVISGAVVNTTGWRVIFAAIALAGALLLYLSARHLPESNRALNPHALRIGPLLRNYLAIAGNAHFWAYAMTGAATYCALFAFISGSPYVIIQGLDYSELAFGWMFSLITAFFILGAFSLNRLVPRYGIRAVLFWATGLSAGCGVVMGGLALSGESSLISLMVPVCGITYAHGLINATAQVAAIAPFPDKAGAAAALNGFQMHIFGALVGIWVGKSFDGTPGALMLIIALCTVLCFTFANLLVRHFDRTED